MKRQTQKNTEEKIYRAMYIGKMTQKKYKERITRKKIKKT